jgi:hypothetical protein
MQFNFNKEINEHEGKLNKHNHQIMACHNHFLLAIMCSGPNNLMNMKHFHEHEGTSNLT